MQNRENIEHPGYFGKFFCEIGKIEFFGRIFFAEGLKTQYDFRR